MSILARIAGPLAWRFAGSWYFMLWGLTPYQRDRVMWGIMLARFVRGWRLHPLPARRYHRLLRVQGIEYNGDAPSYYRPQSTDNTRRIKRSRKDRKILARVGGAILGALLAFNM